MEQIQNVWSIVDRLPTNWFDWMSVPTYLGLSVVAILVGAVALRGNPTRGA